MSFSKVFEEHDEELDYIFVGSKMHFRREYFMVFILAVCAF